MTDRTEARDPELPGRLLTAERDALIPLLRTRPDEDFAIPTAACPGWTVRDVLAHCSSSLMRVVERRYEEGVFSPEMNDRDIAERADWTNAQVIDELERGMTEVGPIIAKTRGRLDVLPLGEWVHAGDVREALGEPGAYGGESLPIALSLLAWVTGQREHVPLLADIDGVDDPLRLGAMSGERPPARYIGDGPTLIRLYSGRPLTGASYELAGVEESELNIFG
jgi:uncharacterized protein (TIGR03083 family)